MSWSRFVHPIAVGGPVPQEVQDLAREHQRLFADLMTAMQYPELHTPETLGLLKRLREAVEEQER